MDVGAVDFEHVGDHLQACSGIVDASAAAIAMLPAGSPALNRDEALSTGGDSAPSGAIP
jgi:hypothetical protein